MTIRRACIFPMSNLEQSPSVQKFDGRFPKVSCKKIIYGYSSELKKNRLTVNHLQVRCFLCRSGMAAVLLTPVCISPWLGAASDGPLCAPRYHKNVRYNILPRRLPARRRPDHFLCPTSPPSDYFCLGWGLTPGEESGTIRWHEGSERSVCSSLKYNQAFVAAPH